MLKRMDHIAVAVNKVDDAVNFYQKSLRLSLSGSELVTAQKTMAAFFKVGELNIELVAPTAMDSPLTKFLETKGQGIHHICFEVDDIEKMIGSLLERDVMMVDPSPRPGAHNTKVAFIHPKSSGGVLIELCEYSKGKP